MGRSRIKIDYTYNSNIRQYKTAFPLHFIFVTYSFKIFTILKQVANIKSQSNCMVPSQ